MPTKSSLDQASNPTSSTPSTAMEAVLEVMRRLRDPQTGCPWDKQQTLASIAPYTIEEAYEVADAIERGALGDLKEELGDLLFQVVFHARMAEELGAFDFAAVAQGLADKMRARHPHVFADGAARTADEQTRHWEELKARERGAKQQTGVLDDVAMNLPALMRAEKLTKRAARIGFDWPDAAAVLEKLDEELAELGEARGHGDLDAMEDEMGDVLFVMANLARKIGVDPEKALRRANSKFTRRFQFIERRLRDEGKTGVQKLEELEALWVEAKNAERGE